MKRVRLISALMLPLLATAGLLIWRAPRVSAQGQSNANMLVVTAVTRKCFVTTASLDFGQYDPVQANATAALDAQSTLTVACTKGTVFTIDLDNGVNATGDSRRMVGGAGSHLNYDLYQDPARTLRWGNVAGQILDGGVAPSRDPRTFTVYGRIPGAQDVEVGQFQDTVLVTVNF